MVAIKYLSCPLGPLRSDLDACSLVVVFRVSNAIERFSQNYRENTTRAFACHLRVTGVV